MSITQEVIILDSVERASWMNLGIDNNVDICVLITAGLMLFNLSSLHLFLAVRALRDGPFEQDSTEYVASHRDIGSTVFGTVSPIVVFIALVADGLLATLECVELSAVRNLLTVNTSEVFRCKDGRLQRCFHAINIKSDKYCFQ